MTLYEGVVEHSHCRLAACYTHRLKILCQGPQHSCSPVSRSGRRTDRNRGKRLVYRVRSGNLAAQHTHGHLGPSIARPSAAGPVPTIGPRSNS